MDIIISKLMKQWIDGYQVMDDGWMDEWIDAWLDGQMNGWMDGWMEDRQIDS